MKLLLINPSKYDEQGNLMKFKYGTFPPLNLLILASLIKKYKQVKITIIDEFIEDIPFKSDFDLVGITTLFSSSFPRVIDISKKFRNKGIPVTLGGTHATCDFENSIKYVDSIVVGEAENAFEELIEDFLINKKLKNIYKNKNFIELKDTSTIIPRYDLINLNKYFRIGVRKKLNIFPFETSRGCPMNCNFCTVRITHGTKIRYKPISNIIKEIKFLKDHYNASYFSFTDDNFLFNYERSKDLLNALSKENIRFFCEISTRIIDMPNLIPLLKKAGCVTALMGIESINSESLNAINKLHNEVTEYKRLFFLFNKYQITLLGSFIFGSDYDNNFVFSDVFKFLKDNNVKRAIFNILTPFPGTELYRQLKKRGRIINHNLSLYDICHVVYNPIKLTKKQIEEGFWKLYRKFYSLKEIIIRLFKSDKSNLIYLLFADLRFRKLVYKKIYPYSSGIKRINKIK